MPHELFDTADWWLEEAFQSLPHEVLQNLQYGNLLHQNKTARKAEKERGHNLLQPNLNVKSYHICYILFIKKQVITSS